MSYPDEQTIGLDGVCPHLGLADDHESHATYATEAHRCYKLPSPTRIAANHQETYCLGANHGTCPVFQGEGIARTQTPAASPRESRPAGGTVAAGEGAAGGPRGSSAAFGRSGGGTAPGGRPGQGARRPPPGPRPRPGGISMPAATAGLLALAIAVVVIAFFVQRAVGDDDDDTPSAASAAQTQAALDTRQAGVGSRTQVPVTQQPGTQPAGTRPAGTPGTPGTPAGSPSPGTGTPGTGAKTYTVVAGDTCGGIAAKNNIELAQLLSLNNLTEDSCRALQVGQSLRLP